MNRMSYGIYFQCLFIVWFAALVTSSEDLDETSKTAKLHGLAKADWTFDSELIGNIWDETEVLRMIQTYLGWIQLHIEQSEVTILTLLDQIQAEHKKGVYILSTDSILMLTPKGYYVSLSYIIIIHLAVFIIITVLAILKSFNKTSEPSQANSSLDV
ncbi:uncharacterized protein LOC131430613 [Malaya genurostris]|uniref:uncharacterized protein LOC131430613 n=1 Tax=Malaya genurostris TaxID=325434 RepID=UPI0026F3BBDA|nr:uncharacterized protein LOC131430613 [Malaya genurostris]